MFLRQSVSDFCSGMQVKEGNLWNRFYLGAKCQVQIKDNYQILYSGAGSQCNDIQSSYFFRQSIFIFLRCVESSTVFSVLSSFVKVTHCYHLASGTYTIGCHLHTIKFDERVHKRWIVLVKARNLMGQHGKFGANGGLLFKLRSVS